MNLKIDKGFTPKRNRPGKKGLYKEIVAQMEPGDSVKVQTWKEAQGIYRGLKRKGYNTWTVVEYEGSQRTWRVCRGEGVYVED